MKNESNIVMLSRKHSYYSQVQGQLLVAREVSCDFVCWTTNSMFIENIEEDSNFQAKMIPKLEKFFRTYLLPELLTHHLKMEKFPWPAVLVLLIKMKKMKVHFVFAKKTNLA